MPHTIPANQIVGRGVGFATTAVDRLNVPDSTTRACARKRGRPPTTPLWHRSVALLLRNFYFRVRVVGVRPPAAARRLVLCSHRNGAIDGYLVLAAFPEARFLLSVQWLRNPLLRLMFAGIPVVRDKDRQRLGLDARRFASPVEAALSCLERGGCVAMFPEGTSSWGPKPLRYAPGAARIACLASESGMAPLEIVPVGLFYRHPDRFRARAELLVGAPILVPERAGREFGAWVAQTEAVLAAALDAVSVNCTDTASFERVERRAAARSGDGRSYALAFKACETQARPMASEEVEPRPRPKPPRAWEWPCVALAALLLAPILLVGLAAGARATTRHTVTLRRMLAGSAAAVMWVPILAILAVRYPQTAVPMAAVAAYGWWRWPEP